MKKLDKVMRHSIRIRLMLTLAIILMFTIFLCWVLNKTFLTKYYEYNKVDTLGKVYSDVNNLYNVMQSNNQLEYNIIDKLYGLKHLQNFQNAEEEVALIMERLDSNRNISVYVFNLDYNTPTWIYPLDMNRVQENQLIERLSEFYSINGIQLENKKVMKQAENYSTYKVYDKRIGSNYLELFGTLDNNSVIYIRTNIETMQESVAVANKFLGYIGVLATFVGIISMYFISRSFTTPILELSEIAKKMSDLDFNVKYPVEKQNEIGILGSSINSLSERLEQTISELKSANNELLTDIEHKTQIDEVRKDFLSSVSHELKTPIALIQGYAEGLKENISDDQDSRDFYCEVIIDEAAKMNSMVKKLLSLNQIEFGTNQVEMERFDICLVIQSILTASEILFQQKNVTVEYEQNSPVFVWADQYMVEEVLNNYVSNALNHVSAENIIEIKLTHRLEVIRISVFNTGENIPEEDLENIWIKFYKVDKARTREYGGSGIGLSLVQAIMTAMNRDYGVINRDNGVEFWFELDTRL